MASVEGRKSMNKGGSSRVRDEGHDEGKGHSSQIEGNVDEEEPITAVAPRCDEGDKDKSSQTPSEGQPCPRGPQQWLVPRLGRATSK